MPSGYDRRTVLRSCGSTLSLALAGCLGGAPAGTETVDMTDDFTFEPETVTVARDGTVTWVNVGSVRHTVTAYEDGIPDGAAYFASGGFDAERTARNNVTGGLIASGEAYEHTFEEAGTYDYFCIPHEGSGMVGTVRIE
jgi:plastocyanin